MSQIPTSRLMAVSALAAAGMLLAACGSNASSTPSSSGHDMSSHDMASMSESSMPSVMPSMDSSEVTVTDTQVMGDQNDVMFARMMIPHHQQAVEMADIAMTNPDISPFVRSLAEKIKAAQQPEIDLMSSWLKEWGAEPAPESTGEDMQSMDMGHGGLAGMMSTKQMSELTSAKGDDFNRLWLEMMIEHHKGAVEMAEGVLATTGNEEVSALAKAILSGQRAEIDEMQAELDR